MENEFRKIVGKLLWSTKKDFLKYAYNVRELFSYSSCPGKEQWDRVSRVIGFLLEKLDRVLKV